MRMKHPEKFSFCLKKITESYIFAKRSPVSYPENLIYNLARAACKEFIWRETASMGQTRCAGIEKI